jgi:hypothetical protein
MRLRLRITDPKGSTFDFEHKGSNVRIGRDPEGELVLRGEASQTVSWNHARVDLTPQGAHLTDLGSTNGTLLNDQRVAERVSLRVGDEIRMGQTGAVLKVVELDLSEVQAKASSLPPPKLKVPAPQGGDDVTLPKSNFLLNRMQRLERMLLIAVCLLGLIGVVVGAIFWFKPSEPVAVLPPEDNPAGDTGSATTTTRPATSPKRPGENSGRLAMQFTPDEFAPSVEHKAVGTYVSPPKAPPSVLLHRHNDPYPWGQLRPDNRVYTSNYLVSLPGYRSKVYLDSGVQLTLWGNVPEFSSFPPVLESTVMLNVPATGIDLDFILDHGRVHLANYKPTGDAHVRARFHNEIWDLTLPDSQTAVVLESWGSYPRDIPFSKQPGRKGPMACVGLFVQGRAHLKTRQRSFDLNNLSQLVWTNASPELDGPETLPQLPEWWTSRIAPDKDKPQVVDAMIALEDYAATFAKTDTAVDAILTQVKESPNPSMKTLGILFLGALDQVLHLTDALENRQYPEVRGAAAFALRHWMSRSADHDLELYRLLHERKGYLREKAEIIMHLLHSVSEADAAKPETYQKLVGYLDHENLAIRDLAFWHLTLLVPEGAKSINYDPAADSEKRKQGVEQWRKLVPPGKVPAPPRAAGRSS